MIVFYSEATFLYRHNFFLNVSCCGVAQPNHLAEIIRVVHIDLYKCPNHVEVLCEKRVTLRRQICWKNVADILEILLHISL